MGCGLTRDDQKPRGYPKVIHYVEIAGEWERELHPNWPESKFHVPDEVPYGTIYIVRKGTYAGYGLTAHIELTPEGHVVKTPKNNPYDRRREEQHRAEMRIEADVYRRVGPDCPYIPRMLAWDPETCCLSIEHLANGALFTYVQGIHFTEKDRPPPTIETALRRRWALQATRGLRALHAVGVIHADLTPQNVLLGADANLRVADFAGSCLDGAPYAVCAGERYVAPGWSFDKTPTRADDIFLLGGLLYFILTGQKPHHDVADELDVPSLYAAGTFPDVAGLDAAVGAVLQGCWDGSLTSADAVLERLLAAFGTDDDPLAHTTAGPSMQEGC